MRKCCFFFLPLVAAAGLLGLSACRDEAARTTATSTAAEREFSVSGVIREPLANGRIVIEHEAIAGFMPAMTMPFFVADEAAAGLASGDQVRFRFVVGETSRADRFVIVGREASRPAVAAMAGDEAAIKRLKVGDVVPDFRLVDHLDQPVNAAHLDDRFTLITFIFTRCPVPEFCPAITARFAALQTRLQQSEGMRGRVRLLGVTLDPEFDRPEILRAYADAVGVEADQWRLATGDTRCVEQLAKAFSVHAVKRAGTLDHTLCTALIGPDRRVREIWRGNGWTMDEVLTAITGALDAR